MTEAPTAEDVAGGTRAFGIVTALFIAGCLAAGYSFASADGRWPLGHPWAALILSCLGLVLVVMGTTTTPRRMVLPLRVLIALSLASAITWLLATALAV